MKSAIYDCLVVILVCTCSLQELLNRLGCFPMRPAVLPTLLSDQPEDEDEDEEEDEEVEPEVEPAEDIETEELMRSIASRLTPAARFRWRRSRWLRHCPVALADGILTPGKAEYTVSYAELHYLTSCSA